MEHAHTADEARMVVVRRVLGATLIVAVIALMLYAIHVGLPGTGGIERESNEAAPLEQPTR